MVRALRCLLKYNALVCNFSPSDFHEKTQLRSSYEHIFCIFGISYLNETRQKTVTEKGLRFLERNYSGIWLLARNFPAKTLAMKSRKELVWVHHSAHFERTLSLSGRAFVIFLKRWGKVILKWKFKLPAKVTLNSQGPVIRKRAEISVTLRDATREVQYRVEDQKYVRVWWIKTNFNETRYISTLRPGGWAVLASKPELIWKPIGIYWPFTLNTQGERRSEISKRWRRFLPLWNYSAYL